MKSLMLIFIWLVGTLKYSPVKHLRSCMSMYMYMIHVPDSACSSLTQEGFKMNHPNCLMHLSRKTGTAVEVKPKGKARFYITDWLVLGRLVDN